MHHLFSPTQPYTDPRVAQRLKELLSSWANEFKNDTKMNPLIKFIEQLRRDGITFQGAQQPSSAVTATRPTVIKSMCVQCLFNKLTVLDLKNCHCKLFERLFMVIVYAIPHVYTHVRVQAHVSMYVYIHVHVGTHTALYRTFSSIISSMATVFRLSFSSSIPNTPLAHIVAKSSSWSFLSGRFRHKESHPTIPSRDQVLSCCVHPLPLSFCRGYQCPCSETTSEKGT